MELSGFLPGRMKFASAGGRLKTSGCPGVEKSAGVGPQSITKQTWDEIDGKAALVANASVSLTLIV